MQTPVDDLPAGDRRHDRLPATYNNMLRGD